jgi:hypothetical protein
MLDSSLRKRDVK